MNDALKQKADAEASEADPATEKLLMADETESAITCSDRLPKPRASLLETVYYWVITRS
jgi:hypothetical protein